jgi:hypothetical protein
MWPANQAWSVRWPSLVVVMRTGTPHSATSAASRTMVFGPPVIASGLTTGCSTLSEGGRPAVTATCSSGWSRISINRDS